MRNADRAAIGNRRVGVAVKVRLKRTSDTAVALLECGCYVGVGAARQSLYKAVCRCAGKLGIQQWVISAPPPLEALRRKG